MLGPPSGAGDSVLARRLWLAAEDRAALLDREGQAELLRQALAADPAFLPAVYGYISVTQFRPDLRAEYAHEAALGEGPFARCVALVASAPPGYPAAAAPGLLALEQSHQATACSALFLSSIAVELTPQRIWHERVLEYLERATAAAPALHEPWLRRAIRLRSLGRVDESRAVVEEGITRSQHPLHRIILYSYLANALATAGDTVKAGELRRALAAAVERDGRPGLRAEAPAIDAAASLERVQERLRIASAAGSPWEEWSARRAVGSGLSDAGRPAEALLHLDRAVRIADSLGTPMMQQESYRFRGRVYEKLGRHTEAEGDLRRAIAVGTRVGDRYFLAEAYHNLAHVYEGQGRMAEASRTVDRFIELTRPLQHAQPRMMSLHDGGLIRWKAGWPAAANAAFAEMVRVVDEQERGHHWAGEYFERIGDLPRALHYYRKGAVLDPEERSLNLAGLARVYQDLGLADSAEVAARAHDSVMSNQLDVPMLPPILAAAGRSDEAVTIARAWARKQAGQGNVHGAALATNALAELLLRYGDARTALREAAVAESLAQRINLTDQLIRAHRLQGQSRLGMHDRAGGLRLLNQAAVMAAAHPTAEAVLLSQLALGDALAEASLPDQALTAYDRAARVVEGMTVRLERDFDRARFRHGQLAAFDGAVGILLRQPATPRRLAELAAWSQRRKAASLALAAGGQAGSGGGARTLGLDELRRRLPPGAALVDVQTLDSTSAALVVTSQGSRVILLQIRPDSLRSLVDRLRRPLARSYAGRVDLARAPFDLAIAQALYRAVLAPLAPLLGGIDRLYIVPDGPLHLVPFDALVSESPSERTNPSAYSSSRYAMDRFQIEILPTAQFLPSRDPAPGTIVAGPNRVLAINRDAPGGAAEVAAIRAAWPAGQVTLLEGIGASETAVRKVAGKYTILHFATHAEADDREPLASHLRLGADSLADGFFHLEEIAEDRRPARLAVLSACETLSGRLYQGEGLMGLARAFLAGGAQAVVATQWPIGPASADLMGEFHRALAGGNEPGAALRSAKLALRRRPATAHPFYWAGVILIRGARAD
jgi:CHAT domain-containing protein